VAVLELIKKNRSSMTDPLAGKVAGFQIREIHCLPALATDQNAS
jgi:hypothetical protein